MMQGTQSWCSVTTWRDGKGGGRRFRREGTHDYGQFMLMYGKNHHNVVKSYPPIKINKYVF